MASTTRPRKTGIDTLLQSRGKSLKMGQELSLSLVKSSLSFQSEVGDPQGKDKEAPLLQYPLIAKFPESVVRPSFAKMTRLMEQAAPSQKDDSEDEEDEELPDQPPKKKYRRRKDAPKRQWILQEETDYLETQISQQEQGKAYRLDPSKYSSRYEGTAEYNPSHYMLIGASPNSGQLEVTLLPTPHAVHSFFQPSAAAGMSLNQAEQHVQDSRMAGTRYKLQHGSSASTNKMRLLNKLKSISKTRGAAAEEEEGDDIMADVRFVERKGTSGKARMELLSESTDVVTMDGEGVLGGANDGEFGGKRRFAHRQVDSSRKSKDKNDAGDGGGGTSNNVGNDGRAMADDFYKRDVKAEYEELDYDANDQFDDDDVDLGEGEVNVIGENSMEQDYETSSDEEGDDDDEYGSGDGSGLASTNGLRAMLAKARGETPATAQPSAAKPTSGADESKKDVAESDADKRDESAAEPSVGGAQSAATSAASNPADGSSNGSLRKVIEAAEAAREAAAKSAADGTAKRNKPTGVEVNAQGERLLTLEAVQREIWLHHGSIPVKKLMKIFSIKRKTVSADRRAKFQQLILELCNIGNDPVQGKMLQLKQHYASLE